MGAELIGFLFKGPARLSRSKKSTRLATKRARNVRNALGQLRAMSELPLEFPTVLRHLDNDQIQEALDNFDALPAPEVAVTDLLDWWDEGARDTATRRDPDDPAQVIGFAGAQTWGDEPDGVGYRTYRAALTLDILGFFGIR